MYMYMYLPMNINTPQLATTRMLNIIPLSHVVNASMKSISTHKTQMLEIRNTDVLKCAKTVSSRSKALV
jgi:hypothetical protein